jgi:hypothetical protein
MGGVELRISEEAGRHFMGPVPSERNARAEASGSYPLKRDRILARYSGDAVETLKELTCPRASPV